MTPFQIYDSSPALPRGLLGRSNEEVQQYVPPREQVWQAVEDGEAMGQDMRYYVPHEEDALHRPGKMVAEEAAQLSLPME